MKLLEIRKNSNYSSIVRGIIDLNKIDMKNSIFIFMIIVLGVVDILISILGLFTYVFLGIQWFICLINILVVGYLFWKTYKTVKNK